MPHSFLQNFALVRHRKNLYYSEVLRAAVSRNEPLLFSSSCRRFVPVPCTIRNGAGADLLLLRRGGLEKSLSRLGKCQSRFGKYILVHPFGNYLLRRHYRSGTGCRSVADDEINRTVSFPISE